MASHGPWSRIISPLLGQELVPGLSLFGTIWLIKGDMEWLSNSLELDHASSHQMCVWCRANDLEPEDHELIGRIGDDSTPWNDISRGALWRDTVYISVEEWYLCHGGRVGCHPLLSLPGVSGMSIMADTLHIMDLGYVLHCLGNVLWYFCWREHYFGVVITPQQRLDRLWNRIDHQYRARDTPFRLGSLSLTAFADPDRPHRAYPCLSSRVKAAASRHLVPIIASIFSDVRGLGEEDMHISSMLDSLASREPCCLPGLFEPELD